ncbi:MAG: hypothetical protein R2838_16975 [Caldilineaceae bacterium]
MVTPAIYQRLLQGLGTFSPNCARPVALFVRFAGIDYDGDDAAGAKLDQFIRRVQAVVARYGRHASIDLNIGDKAATLYINFGAPRPRGRRRVRCQRRADSRHTAPRTSATSRRCRWAFPRGRMRAGVRRTQPAHLRRAGQRSQHGCAP